MSASTRRACALLAAVSAVLLACRCLAVGRVGFGDSEALYASYALHPQAAYLDHPGIVGLLARALGGGRAPSPAGAHAFTAAAATVLPLLMVLVCEACGATWRRALIAGAVVAVVPEFAIGLFAMTPDLPLAFTWLGVIGAAALAVRAEAGSARAYAAFSAAGLLAGIAAASKVSGALLFPSLAAAYLAPPARRHAATAAPWAGLLAGALVVAPVVAFEHAAGWPLFRHRLVDTQTAAGVSARNAAALVLGQVAYLSPGVAWLAVGAARRCWTDRDDEVGSLLFWTSALPAAVLATLCLWSRVAEPHWLAPATLALVPAAARNPVAFGRRALTGALVIAGVLTLGVHAWVLFPPALPFASTHYDPKVDIANELVGWPEVVSAVRDEASAVRAASDVVPVVAGPHWTVCAQLEAALERELQVGCNTPIRDDFDAWFPRAEWQRSDVVLWVTDARFPATPAFAARYAVLRRREVLVSRGGRVVRRFTVTTLVRAEAA